jgi:type II secretory pathway pseudopilin PulG
MRSTGDAALFQGFYIRKTPASAGDFSVDRKNRGFALLRLIIGVAMIVALIAVSALYVLPSKIKANEDAARDSLHTFNAALWEYWSVYETYPKALANLSAGAQTGLASADMIDAVLASGKKNGYVFEYVPGDLDFDGTTSTFHLTAKPRFPGLTGRQIFSMNETGVVQVVAHAPAITASSTP